MLLSSFFTRSMVFAHLREAQLPFTLLSETFLTIRQNSLYVTVCMIVCTFYQGYFIHSLSTLYYYNAPSLTTRLTGDYRDRTCTGKCDPALLDTQSSVGSFRSQYIIISSSFTDVFLPSSPHNISIRQSFHPLCCRKCLIAGTYPSEAVTAASQCLLKR